MKREKRTEVFKRLREFEKSIKIYCYDCNGGVKKIDCGGSACPLYPHRPFGRSSTKGFCNNSKEIINNHKEI